MSAGLEVSLRLIGTHPTHLRRLGQGPRQVLALHCSLAHGGAWAALGAEIGDAATLIAPDLPSHGLSAEVSAPEALHDTATAMAKALAREIGGGGPIDILGHSFGGSVALRLALEAPELVARLTLFEPVLFSAARPALGPGTRHWLARQTEVDDLVRAGRVPEAARRFNADWGHGTAFDDLSPRQQQNILDRLHLITASNDVLWEDAPGLMAQGRLEALAVPVLLAEGSASPAVIGEINTALAARLPQAQRLKLAGAGHMLPLSHAKALAPEVRAHLRLGAAQD